MALTELGKVLSAGVVWSYFMMFFHMSLGINRNVYLVNENFCFSGMRILMYLFLFGFFPPLLGFRLNIFRGNMGI